MTVKHCIRCPQSK